MSNFEVVSSGKKFSVPVSETTGEPLVEGRLLLNLLVDAGVIKVAAVETKQQPSASALWNVYLDPVSNIPSINAKCAGCGTTYASFVDRKIGLKKFKPSPFQHGSQCGGKTEEAPYEIFREFFEVALLTIGAEDLDVVDKRESAYARLQAAMAAVAYPGCEKPGIQHKF